MEEFMRWTSSLDKFQRPRSPLRKRNGCYGGAAIAKNHAPRACFPIWRLLCYSHFFFSQGKSSGFLPNFLAMPFSHDLPVSLSLICDVRVNRLFRNFFIPLSLKPLFSSPTLPLILLLPTPRWCRIATSLWARRKNVWLCLRSISTVDENIYL